MSGAAGQLGVKPRAAEGRRSDRECDAFCGIVR